MYFHVDVIKIASSIISTTPQSQHSTKAMATEENNKELTLAEQEAFKRNGNRKSKRFLVSQKVKTTRLRRIHNLFWNDDTLYNSDNSNTNENSTDEKEAVFTGKRKRNGKQTPELTDPESHANDSSQIEMNFGGRLKLKRIHSSPHFYTIDDFFTDKELQKIKEKIVQAEKQKRFQKSFVDSQDKMKRKNDEQDSLVEEGKVQRTSSFIHFSKLSDSTIASIENRAADLLSLPNHSIEPLQLVRYEQGNYFHNHHDLGILYEDGSVELPHKSSLTPPRRIITILVYLNDLPDDDENPCGGSTIFPSLGKDVDELAIRPKENRAVMWCNIKKDGTPDERLVHRGETLYGDAVKYAMNIWACEDS